MLTPARPRSGATKIEGRAGTRWTYTTSGMTTNIAARLAAVAEGGEIIVSETTHDRLVPLIECGDLGERMLKRGSPDAAVPGGLRLYAEAR